MESLRDKTVQAILRSHNILVATPSPVFILLANGSRRFNLNQSMKTALSTLVTVHGYSIKALVELVRGQTIADYRPNKALCPVRLAHLLHGYKHAKLICSVAAGGIEPRWKQDIPMLDGPSKNHQSANRNLNAVIRSIRDGQDAGQYLVLSDAAMMQAQEIHVSPLGAVAKKDVDPREEVRVIHDLSYPRGRSANDASDKQHFPAVEYHHVASIARRIESLNRAHPDQAIYILKGDVKSAFRHLMLASSHVCQMGARIPQLQALLLDMSAPFGWSGSPSFYGAFGGAISWLVEHESPASLSGGTSTDHEPFFAYEWVDDHILVEVDTSSRLHYAQEALRLAMLAILGPRAINEKKFSAWATELEVLGLLFNTRSRTVSMPRNKIAKGLLPPPELIFKEKNSGFE